ncbi:hypothetical protein D3C78_1753000 [compost metagenome]
MIDPITDLCTAQGRVDIFQVGPPDNALRGFFEHQGLPGPFGKPAQIVLDVRGNPRH